MKTNRLMLAFSEMFREAAFLQKKKSTSIKMYRKKYDLKLCPVWSVKRFYLITKGNKKTETLD